MAKKNDIKTVRLKARAYKATISVAAVLFVFYLVLYLKEVGFTRESYFANYENAVTVWSVGFELFQTLMNTLDSITGVLGKILDFIINSIDSIILFFTDRLGNWWDNFANWFNWNWNLPIFGGL